MHPWRFVCVALLMNAGIASAGWPTTGPATRPAAESKSVVRDGLSVSLALSQTEFPDDQQPQWIVQFRNVSSDYINLYDVDAYWNWQFQFTNTDPHAADPGPWQLRMGAIPHRYPLSHRQLLPRETGEVRINLNDPPFTFDFSYAGVTDDLIAPVRRLPPGTYRMVAVIGLTSPFPPGNHEWTGPVTSEPVELSIIPVRSAQAPPTTQQIAAYDQAIDGVINSLPPYGLWSNGGFPAINLPASASPEEVIDSAVNVSILESKAYRILRLRKYDRPDGVKSAALLLLGGKPKVLFFSNEGAIGWWTRFYDTTISVPTTQPLDRAR